MGHGMGQGDFGEKMKPKSCSDWRHSESVRHADPTDADYARDLAQGVLARDGGVGRDLACRLVPENGRHVVLGCETSRP